MRLYLMQHGEALPKEVDADRPLSQRGRGDVERLAAFLGQRGVAVERIYHSGKTRAKQTAEILGARIAPGLAPERLAGINPDDPSEPIATDIGGWRDDTLLVSHQPFLGKLTAALVAGDETTGCLSFEPGTIVYLENTPSLNLQNPSAGTCPADVDGSGAVDVPDVLEILAAWGQSGVPADVNGDTVVDVLDFLEVLSAWGPCP